MFSILMLVAGLILGSIFKFSFDKELATNRFYIEYGKVSNRQKFYLF